MAAAAARTKTSARYLKSLIALKLSPSRVEPSRSSGVRGGILRSRRRRLLSRLFSRLTSGRVALAGLRAERLSDRAGGRDAIDNAIRARLQKHGQAHASQRENNR